MADTRRRYGPPNTFMGLGTCFVAFTSEEPGEQAVAAVAVDTSDGLHFVTLTEAEWDALHAEIKATFARHKEAPGGASRSPDQPR